MAGNKFNGPRDKFRPEEFRLSYKGKYNVETVLHGSAKHIIKHLIELL